MNSEHQLDLLHTDDANQSTIQCAEVLPEAFIRKGLLSIGRIKTTSVIDDTVAFMIKNEGISAFKKSVRATIYRNRDSIETLYKLIVSCSDTLENERQMSPETIELILFMSNSRSRTEETIANHRKALDLFFIQGESVTETASRTGIAAPNVTRMVKGVKEKLKVASELAKLLVEKRD